MVRLNSVVLTDQDLKTVFTVCEKVTEWEENSDQDLDTVLPEWEEVTVQDLETVLTEEKVVMYQDSMVQTE